ncbi:MAG: response regulator transcription factor [Sphingosinicella sp.]|nr:response regulator transcription factor [Sphingosinicella sp.]
MRVLLVEDEPELGATVVARLSAAGFVVDHFTCLGDAIEAVLSAQYRAVLLDRRLPDGDGLSLIAVLKTRPSPPPVLILTALDDVPDRVAGLDAGAEDYLIKPFAFEELLARLRVLLRRNDVGAHVPLITIGRLAYDLAAREPIIDGHSLALPRRELAILDALMRRAGRVVMRENLEANVYGFDDDISSNALEAHISRLRKRLADAQAGVILHGVRGVGYMLRAA